MARHYFGLSRADNLNGAQPTIDTTSTAKEVEISILDGAAGMTKLDIEALLDKIRARILADQTAAVVYP